MPVSTAIIVDTSNSRRDHLAQAKQVALEFIQAMGTGDEILVLGLGSATLANFTLDLGVARQLVTALKAAVGPTSLFDTIFSAVDQLSRRGPERRKVILVNSDGDDNRSSRSAGQIEALL